MMDKILIVDDDPVFLKSLTPGLKKYESQFKVLTATNVDDAVSLLQEHPISVVVTDLVMPHVGGLELIAAVKENYPNLPCVVMTGYGAPAVTNGKHVDSVFPHLQKPFNVHTLAGTIIDAMDRRDEGRVPRKTSIYMLLQLVEIDQKSCAVEVRGRAGRQGVFYFKQGKLMDARFNGTDGERAAMEMIGWGKVAFRFAPLPETGADQRRIDIDLVSLLKAASESNGAGRGNTTVETGTAAAASVAGSVPSAAVTAGAAPIRVLIVDDSKMMRKAVTRIIEPVEDFTIVGEAADGEEALMQIARLQPDVITLDVEMPRMDGITTLKHMMIQTPTPTVMLSSLTKEGSRVTFDALRFGAVDFLTKPSNLDPEGVASQSSEIVRKVKLAASVEIDAVQYIRTLSDADKDDTPTTGDIRHIVGIGAAEGGPGGMLKLIPMLTPGANTAYLAMVYMAPEYIGAFAEYLHQHSRIPVHRAVDGFPLEAGHCYLASGQEYVTLESAGANLILRVHPAPFATRRGSINMMMLSIADAIGSSAAGLLLSGAGTDGAEGLEEIMHAGGTAMVLSPGRCMYKEMVSNAIERCGPALMVTELQTAEAVAQLISSPTNSVS